MSSANVAPKLAMITIREKPRRGFHAFASRTTKMAHLSGHRPLMHHHIFGAAAIGVAWKGPDPRRIKNWPVLDRPCPLSLIFNGLRDKHGWVKVGQAAHRQAVGADDK